MSKHGYWTTREGEKVKITDMGDGHLLRSLRMLRRTEVKRRGLKELDP